MRVKSVRRERSSFEVKATIIFVAKQKRSCPSSGLSYLRVVWWFSTNSDRVAPRQGQILFFGHASSGDCSRPSDLWSFLVVVLGISLFLSIFLLLSLLEFSLFLRLSLLEFPGEIESLSRSRFRVPGQVTARGTKTSQQWQVTPDVATTIYR